MFKILINRVCCKTTHLELPPSLSGAIVLIDHIVTELSRCWPNAYRPDVGPILGVWHVYSVDQLMVNWTRWILPGAHAHIISTLGSISNRHRSEGLCYLHGYICVNKNQAGPLSIERSGTNLNEGVITHNTEILFHDDNIWKCSKL